MIYGTKEGGEAVFKLSAKEHECFLKGEVIKKITGCSKGEFVITLQMKKRKEA